MRGPASPIHASLASSDGLAERKSHDWPRRAIPTVPVAACERHTAPLSMGTKVLVMDTCVSMDLGGAALFDAEARSWEVLQAGPDGQANLGEAVWTGARCSSWRPPAVSEPVASHSSGPAPATLSTASPDLDTPSPITGDTEPVGCSSTVVGAAQ